MDEAFIGTIIAWAPNFAPRGWAFCEGQMLAIRENEALFSLIGNTYGGDGIQNFALPNLRDKSMGNVKYIICLQGLYPMRQ